MSWHPTVLPKEITFAFRSLGKQRAFTTLSILLLALGIGLASAVFTLLWQAIYAHLPVPEPQQLFTFSTNVTHMGRSESDAMAETFSLPTYLYLKNNFKAATGIVARHGEMVNVESPAGPQHLLADFVTGNFFTVLGVKAAIGSTIHYQDDQASDKPQGAVLSYSFSQEAFGGQASAWNSVLRVNGVPFQISGVAAPGFNGLVAGEAPKLYLPVSAFGAVNPGWQGADDWNLRWLNAFVRLPVSLSRQAAEAALQPVYGAATRQELARQGPQPNDYLRELSHEHLSLIPAMQGAHAMLDQWDEPLRILQWMTLALLSLATINVAGLMLARGMRRRHEMLIRYALGASPSDVMRLHFQETLILSIAGGAVGLWIARYAAELLVYLAHMNQRDAFSYAPRGWVLFMHCAAALASGLAVGAFPAWQLARLDLSQGLKEGGLTHSATRSQAVIRRLLASAQISLSLVLVIAAGLFAQALHKLVSVPVGFDPGHLTVFSVDPKLAQSTVQNTELLWSNIAHRLEHTPGVKQVSYGTGGPFPQGADMAAVIPGSAAAARSKQQTGMRSIIGPRYFSTLGVPVIAGREFDERDRTNMPDAVIVNQTLARKLFGNSDPVGRTVTIFNGLDPNWLASIVGVVADHRQSWRRAQASLLYTPAQQARRVTDVTYYVRTAGPSLSEHIIRDIVRQEAPSISSYDVATMSTRMAEFASSDRAMAVLLASFALFALVIAGVGIYGVVSYSTSLRTLEFGVRLSVGATPSNIVRLVLREALIVLTTGIVLGIPLSYFALSMIRHQLHAISFREPGIYGGAVLLLTLCSLLPAWAPARRAQRMSVGDALRHQ